MSNEELIIKLLVDYSYFIQTKGKDDPVFKRYADRKIEHINEMIEWLRQSKENV